MLKKVHTEFALKILVNIKQKKIMNKFNLVGKTGNMYCNNENNYCDNRNKKK